MRRYDDNDDNYNADYFIEAISRYWRDDSFEHPSDQESENVLVPSSRGCAPQKAHEDYGHREAKDPGLIKLSNIMKELQNGVDFNSPRSDWEKFYTFPDPASAKTYVREEMRNSSDVAKFSKTNIVNYDKKAPEKFLHRVIDGLEEGGAKKTKIKFLTGTTGVGKTTFLKYFSRMYREELFLNEIIITRTRHREIQNLKKDRSYNISKAFRVSLINSIVRDIIATCAFEQTSGGAKIADDQAAQQRQHRIQSLVEDMVLQQGKEGENWDYQKVIDKMDDDPDFIYELEPDRKCKLVSEVGKFTKFCIVLDGFDAIRPEEIALFGETDNKPKAEFIQCLSSVLKNSIPKDTEEGRSIRRIHKIFIVASRNITIDQIIDEIESATDNNQILLENEHVIGTSVIPLIKNRLSVLLKKDFSKKFTKEYSNVICEYLKISMEMVRNKHKSIEKNRFVDLFNHNVRDKLRFLTSLFEFFANNTIIDNINYHGTTEIETLKKLSPENLKETLELNISEIGFDLYQIHKLLVLDKDGYFKNTFRRNKNGELIAQFIRGYFDNLFNYDNHQLFHDESNEEQIDKKYAFSKDPVLEKFLILYRISLDGEIPLTVLEQWFADNFRYQRCRPTTLKILLRSGMIGASFKKNTAYIHLTPKGRFIFTELSGVQVYLEHALLNCLVPYFAEKKIIDPMDESSRVWGRHSVSNVTYFIKYLTTVLTVSFKNGQTPQKVRREIQRNVIVRIKLKLIESFTRIIQEGLENEQMRDYFTDLKKELLRIGVKFND